MYILPKRGPSKGLTKGLINGIYKGRSDACTTYPSTYYNADKDSIYPNSTKVDSPDMPNDMRDDIAERGLAKNSNSLYNKKLI